MLASQVKFDPKKMLPVKAWSPSALFLYEGCPSRYQYEKAMSLCTFCFAGQVRKPRGAPDGTPRQCLRCNKKEPPRDPLDFGSKVHKEIESYIRFGASVSPLGVVSYAGAKKNFSVDLRKVKKFIEPVRKAYVAKKARVELELAFTKDWALTGWFDDDCWARFKVDAMVLAMEGKLIDLADWKSGKYDPTKKDYHDQLDSYGVSVLAAGFGESTRGHLVYVESGATVGSIPPATLPIEAGQLHRKDLPKHKKKWEARAKKMFVDKRFAPCAGDLCKYCPYTANKSGPCPY